MWESDCVNEAWEEVTKRYLLSPGRKAVMGGFSWHSWPGCQLALQAEQNSSLQLPQRTSCGRAESDSFSWHTAWHDDDGHHVRHGSSSTSVAGNRRVVRVCLCASTHSAQLFMNRSPWLHRECSEQDYPRLTCIKVVPVSVAASFNSDVVATSAHSGDQVTLTNQSDMPWFLTALSFLFRPFHKVSPQTLMLLYIKAGFLTETSVGRSAIQVFFNRRKKKKNSSITNSRQKHSLALRFYLFEWRTAFISSAQTESNSSSCSWCKNLLQNATHCCAVTWNRFFKWKRKKNKQINKAVCITQSHFKFNSSLRT